MTKTNQEASDTHLERMSSDDPPFLAKDTKISGKFKGAYCEVVILRVEKKIRITVKRDSPATGTTVIEDRHIPADKLVLGAKIDVVIDGERVKGTVHHFKDNSRYHVVFTDGVQKTLRRICLQCAQRALSRSPMRNPDGTLDSMPLTNPEHFSTPVVRDAARRSTGGAGPSSSTPKTKPKRSSDDDEEEDVDSEDDVPQPPLSTPKPKPKKKDSDKDDDEEGGEEIKKETRNQKAEAKARRERGALARERKRAEIQVLEKHKKRMMAIWKKAVFPEAKIRHVKARKAFLGKKTKSFLRRRPFPKLKRTKRCSLWYASRKYMKQCKKTSLLMTNKTWYHRIREWLKPVKNEKREFRFCVAYRDTRIADGLLRLVDEWLENGGENQELRPPIERRTIEFDQRKGCPVFDHFLDSEWYPAILTRRVFIGTNGQRTREIRNMADGTMQRINEADVIPYEWVPDFDEDDLDYVVRRRVPEMREAFEAAHDFIGKMMRQVPDLDHTTLRIMFGYQKIKKPKTGKLKKLQTRLAPIPTDPEIIESGGESSEDDDDSEDDDSIKNAPTEEKDRFLATLLQSDITLNTSPQIQGYDVDLYYLYGLALKIGAPRKVHAARPWSKWARKLVPQAVDAGPEVEALFKTTLEAHMNTTSKLSFPMEQMVVTTERRAVVPGQYSENRRTLGEALKQMKKPDARKPAKTYYTCSPRAIMLGRRSREFMIAIDNSKLDRVEKDDFKISVRILEMRKQMGKLTEKEFYLKFPKFEKHFAELVDANILFTHGKLSQNQYLEKSVTVQKEMFQDLKNLFVGSEKRKLVPPKKIVKQQHNAQQLQRQQQQLAQTHAAQAQVAAQSSTGPQKRKITPATKPTIFFYTTICRRAVRKVLPKSVLNLRKLSRNLYSAIDEEKILKYLIVQDKKTLLNAAMSAAGDKKHFIVESNFHEGITHLQHTLSSAATGKRSQTATSHPGEPSAKMAKN